LIGVNVRWALGAEIVAGDDPRLAGAARQVDRRHIGGEDALIAGGRHLVPGGQVDPELHHPEQPARLGIGWRMIFLMDDPARGGHPLDVARADHAAIAGGIAMLDFAIIDDGYRLEAAMRVLANPAPIGRRRELMRARIIEQQERADMRAQRIVGK